MFRGRRPRTRARCGITYRRIYPVATITVVLQVTALEPAGSSPAPGPMTSFLGPVQDLDHITNQGLDLDLMMAGLDYWHLDPKTLASRGLDPKAF